MRRKFGFLVILTGIFIVGIVAVKVFGVGGAKDGELQVKSNAPVSVFLDSKLMGQTPISQQVGIGQYTLKLVAESPTSGIAGWQENISVGPKLLTYVNAELTDSELTSAVDVLWLEKLSGRRSELSVLTNPDGATVHIDNETRGTTPLTLTEIGVGDHTLTVTSPGFATRTIKVKTNPGFRLLASLKLALAPGTEPEATKSALPEETKSGETQGASTTASATPAPTGTSANTTSPAKPYVVILDTPTGFLRVRMEPTTSSTEAAKVNPGDEFPLLDEENGWYQIKYEGTSSGWISGTYAKKVK